MKGLFTVRHIEDKYYFEVADSLMGRMLLCVTRFTSVPQGLGQFAGEEITHNTVYFEQRDTAQLLMREYVKSHFSNPEDQISLTLNRATIDPMVKAFKIIGRNEAVDEEYYLLSVTVRDMDGNTRQLYDTYITDPGETDEKGWEKVILTLYRIQTGPEELRSFLASCPLWAVTMPQERITEELAAAVADSGTALYCHTVNTLDFVDAWRDKGLTGIYTDYFEPKHWEGQIGSLSEGVVSEAD